ncbi:M4 family metallopeptidase [Pyxidicoccus sp. MSG2]|uniref:M4 family metallopeptidase n=1 Tax=Pyxidicoccus sp. MSG2 TaxID=2996790 RepID=UPI00226F97BC|nr:M4 family metallopeptidase [Pyxidicoccus sp. MSG2]MCY1021340.1 M4 family metallopeptidase [Pyxidicoccus sp. MSG2]
MKKPLLRSVCAVWVGFLLSACGGAGEGKATAPVEKDASDLQASLSALPNAEVLGMEGEIPFFIRGQLGRVGTGAKAQGLRDDLPLRESLRGIAPVFRLRGEDLVLSRVNRDERGHQHLRFQQLKNGMKVVGGELILHADAEGLIYAANGSARDGVKAAVAPTVSEAAAASAAVRGSEVSGAVVEGAAQLVYLLGEGERQTALAYEVRVKGRRGELPADDRVYVDAERGGVLAVHPKVHSVSLRVYSANNGTSLPGTPKRIDDVPSGDAHVDAVYDAFGSTYNCYRALFGRDSYDNAGHALIGTVHYSTNYVNAYWDGTQMVYGDGDGVNSIELGKDPDVTVHELTHAVTETESDLIYAGESGGLNESMSDVFSGVCESWSRGWATDPDVFKIGEDVWTPAITGDALRYMDNPTLDGSSLDYYGDYSSGVDVHYSSGISNLVFALLSKGGTHPRGKTSINVTAIGPEKAGRIFYKANTDYFVPTTTFEQAKVAMVQAAQALGYDAATVQAVSDAWLAVGVPPMAVSLPLRNNVPVPGLGGPKDEMKNYFFEVPAAGTCGQPMQGTLTFSISGGTGDADLYVKLGSPPTLTSFDCRPYLSGNNETCVFNNPAPGSKWYVMVRGYAAYSGVELKVTYTRTDTKSGSVITGQEVQYGPYCAGPGTKLKVLMTGTGDPDLYVRWNAAPAVNAYNCRPYITGAAETCELTYSPVEPAAYLMVRGYAAGTYTLSITQTPP